MMVDTLKIARDLRAAKLPHDQAEAIAAAIGHSIVGGAATRADLAILEAKIDARFDHLDAKVDARIEGLRSTLILWFIGTGLTLAAVIIAAVKL